ncbi:HEAT repeat domain-containing protein [Bacillus sp. JJ1562]|uniref:HEAT repeat domain-containing protein n=1 Tax=Bacillus sp. JJ1562 TaxID=3122960 RepID=UPI00300156BB
MIELSLVALYILIIAMLFLLTSLFLYLIIKKYVNNQSRRKINLLKEEFRLKMFHYLQTGEQSHIESNLGQEKVIALLELLKEYSNVLDSPDVNERISAFANKNFTKFIKKELRQRRWSLRMNALYLIEDFYMYHLIENLHSLYDKRRTTVAEKEQILKLLAKSNDEKIVEYIKNGTANISDFSLLTILMNLNDEKLDELIADFNFLPARIQYMVVETIGKKQLLRHHTLLKNLIHQDDPELVIRSLKAYATTGVPVDIHSIVAFFESESWQLRLMAAKVAGVQRMEELKEKLIELLSDSEYIVRVEAAKAILRFKDGVRILNKIKEESNDLFAQDMAIEWLEKERSSY